MAATAPRNVLILCTGNSARSIMAEQYINAVSRGRWKAFSAGSKPTGKVNPLALATLAEAGIEPSEARSKSWDEFAGVDAPTMDLVITVCDNAANETCPFWPGSPRTLHWPFPDPAAAEGSFEHRMATFRGVFDLIRANVDAFLVEEAATGKSATS